MKNSNGHLVKVSFSIALLSIAIISFQLSLIQILSIIQWHHFAYMVISIAMLGFGAAGTFVAIFRNKLLNRFDTLLPIFMITSGLFMAIVVAVSQISLIQYDSHHLFSEYLNFWKLLITYLLFISPFFFGALAIGLVFVKNVEMIGKLYFANMFGSGLGGLAVIGIMWVFFPEKIPSIIALLPIIAGAVIIKDKNRLLYIFTAAAVVLVSLSHFFSPDIRLSEYKSLSKALNLPDTEISESKSSPYGLIDIVSSQHIRYAPGLSIKYPGLVSINNVAFKNGNWLGPLSSQNADTTNYFSYSTTALPYIMNKRNRVLILGAGTGKQVEHALKQNVKEVIAVEPDKALTNLLSDAFTINGSSTYNQKGVSLSSISPRTYLMKSKSTYDLISLPIIGSFGGSSGLFALQEQYILTKEAFHSMWQQLNDNGVISITTWIDYPYRNPLKLIASLAEVLERENKNPIEHIAAIKNWNTITFAIKRATLKGEEIKVIREFCKKLNFDPVILPDIKADEREKFNRLQDKSLYLLIDRILASPEEREKVYSEYPFNIKPAVDDKPYFSQFIQWKSIPQIIELFGTGTAPFFEIGYVLLYVTFAQTVLLSIILIVLPLIKLGSKGGGPPSLIPTSRDGRASKTWSLLYFSGLGLGYMFIEIIFIQQFTLYFGNVVYAAAAVVSLMLISSGVGSFISQRYSAINKNIAVVSGIIILLITFHLIFLSPLLKFTIGLSLGLKIFFSAVLIVPVAFSMGFPFPLGLRLVSQNNINHVPWAWGINGSVSVISVVLATIIAVELGFVWVMIFAVGAYSLALLVNLRST